MAFVPNPTAVPGITALRQELNYGDAKSLQCQALNDAMRSHRMKFVSSNGLKGSLLIDWKSRDHHSALEEMTQAFLNEDGNGRRYWPDDETSAHYNGLGYSYDHERIKHTLKQLFFRFNYQQYHNTKSHAKRKSNKENQRERSGRTPNDAIDLDQIAEGSSNVPGSEPGKLSRSANEPTFSISSNANTLRRIQPFLPGPQNHPGSVQQLRQNPYHVSGNPAPKLQPLQRHPMVGTMRATPLGQTRRTVCHPEDEPRAKRVKTGGLSCTITPHASTGLRGNPADLFAGRIPPRRRIHRPIPDTAPLERSEEACGSPKSASSSTVAGDVEASGPDAQSLVNKPSAVSWPSPRPHHPPVEGFSDQDTINNYIARIANGLDVGSGLHAPKAALQSTSTNAAPLAQMLPDETALAPPSLVFPPTRDAPSSRPPPALAPPINPGYGRGRGGAANEDHDASTNPPAEKPRVEFVYRVITRQPAYRGDPWVPEGSFRDKTISELEAELPMRVGGGRADLVALRFVLLHVGSGTRAEQIVPRGHDEMFAAAKRYFDGVIRSCIARTAGGGRRALIEFEIEALTDEKPVVDDTFEEAFDW
ncbi:hypothetical protein LX32DRAFT_550942 [Colletotrichum zoysiae]|uniref:Uncharacterized protein n=1 Tax=Colletotrichum zoysiae TaxID=1216348 RepID=A0AAD9MAC7_9PEZI|nr:hypothetical protein LX32DRAFT_550942 [Colletotrichum zoysiae]